MTIIYRNWEDKKSTKIVEKIKDYYQLDNCIVQKIYDNKNIKIIGNIYLDKDEEFVWPNESNGNENIGTCLGTRTHIGILSNGTIVPCCLDSEGIINLGNIYEDDLDLVLNSEKFQAIRKGFQNNKIICDLCKKCTFRHRFNK